MQVVASAPGKAILFGEHAVVYGKPAIAIAVDKRARVKILERNDNKINVHVKNLRLSGDFNLINGRIFAKKGETGILNYIVESIKKVHDGSGIDVVVDIDIPIGAGLGSSAAVTVATIAGILRFNEKDLSKEQIAKYAHEVELNVQGVASPIDTTISTYGGAVYLSKDAESIIPLDINWDIPLVIGYTDARGTTRELVEAVRKKKEAYPEVVDPLIESIGIITDEAKKALLRKDKRMIGELMNINHGLLDALGVNTKNLSDMVYLARDAGALGSKITGAGGGGSIIAYCPDKISEVFAVLDAVDHAILVKISKKGVLF